MTESLSVPAPLPVPLQDEIRTLLGRSRIWYALPALLRPAYARWRQQAFRAMLRAVTVAVPATQLLMLLIVCVQFQPSLSSHDGRIWWQMVAMSATIYALLIAACRQRDISRRYVPVVAVASSLLIALQIEASLMVQDARFAQELSYLCLLSDFSVMLAWRLPALAGAAACLSGLLQAALLAGVQQLKPDWPVLLASQFIAVLYLLAIALVLERADHVSFLRHVLIREEARLRGQLAELLDAQQQQLHALVMQDALTGLANRRHFDQTLSAEWRRLQQEQQPLAVLFIDVDYFKNYNDYYGHAGGDHCLSQVGAALQGCAQRPADLAARYGGEEFVLLLPGTDARGARLVAQRVLDRIDALALPHERSLVSPQLTVSIGCVAVVPDAAGSTALLLKAADEALYQAKQRGRHRVCEHESFHLLEKSS